MPQVVSVQAVSPASKLSRQPFTFLPFCSPHQTFPLTTLCLHPSNQPHSRAETLLADNFSKRVTQCSLTHFCFTLSNGLSWVYPARLSQEAFPPDRWCILTFAPNNGRLLTLFHNVVSDLEAIDVTMSL